MFDDLLGKIDYDKQIFKSKLKSQFEKHFKQNTVRVPLLLYQAGQPLEFCGTCFQSGGPKVKLFAARILLPIFEEFKPTILLSNLEYDCGYFYAEVEWV